MRRLVFLAGASGSGKTTVAEQLRSGHGFVHLDGDAWMHGMDPVSQAWPEPHARAD